MVHFEQVSIEYRAGEKVKRKNLSTPIFVRRRILKKKKKKKKKKFQTNPHSEKIPETLT